MRSAEFVRRVVYYVDGSRRYRAAQVADENYTMFAVNGDCGDAKKELFKTYEFALNV